MSAYAHFALNKKYAGGFYSEEFRDRVRSSKLYEFYKSIKGDI